MNKNYGLAALCGAVGITAGVAAGLGVFARGDGAYETVTSVRGVTYEMATSGVYANNAQQIVAEGVGWDVFTLFIAVPAMLLAVPLVARGSFRGRLLALGLLGYFLYQYLEYAVTWAFGPLFPLFVAIYGASLAGMVWMGVILSREELGNRFGSRFPRRAFAILNVTLATMLTLLWIQRIAIGLGGDLETAGLRGETTMVVQALDLGLMVPSAIFISVLAWRRSSVGYVIAAAYSITALAMASAIAAMLVSAWQVTGTLEVPPLAMFGAYIISASVIAALAFRSARSASTVDQPKTAGAVAAAET